MLTRGLAPLLLAATVFNAAPALAVGPSDPPVVVAGDNQQGVVRTVVTTGGVPSLFSAASIPRQVDQASGKPPVVTCTWTPIAGSSNGTWYFAKCPDGSILPGIFVPLAVAQPTSVVPVVSAATMAQQAVNRLQLPLPAIGHSPSGSALVGLPTWFWVDPGQWRPLRQRTAAGAVQAEVTAKPLGSTWDPGDGSPLLHCAGPGTPYDRTRPETTQVTNCEHVYEHSSATQPQTGPDLNDRFFKVTVTTTWQVTWVGSGGTGGALQAITRTSSFPLAVQQRQTVVTGGSG